MSKMDWYGKTEEQKEMNLLDYNHALFQNNIFFMNAVWEINIITGTVVILCDKDEPAQNMRELLYGDLYQQYRSKRVRQEETEMFDAYLSWESLLRLKEEVSFDIKIRQKSGEWDIYRVVLTPAFDSNGELYCVYLGSRNLQKETSRDLAEYHNQEQFRDALAVNSYFYFDYDLDGDGTMHEEFRTRDGVDLIRRIADREPPISFHFFLAKWYELYDPWFDKPEGKEVFTEEYLRHAYATNDRLINMEIKQKIREGSVGMPEYLQVFIILMKDIRDGHLHAYIICRDVSSFHREAVEDNRKLKDSNLKLKRTIDQEQQFRQSVLSGAVLLYEINLTKNMIQEEFYETIDGRQYPMLELMGLTAPCSFDEFRKRWSEQKVSEDSKENFLRIYNREYLLDAYARGERQLELEFDTILARGIRMTLRNSALLVEDHDTGDIIAMVNGKDVTKQRQEELRQREALKEAYEVTNRANQAKSEFLARISMDIRTPMNAIIGMTAIAGKHLDNPERIQECLKRISQSGKYLLALVDEMLDMSMIESGRMEFDEKVINLTEQFENLCILSQLQAEEKGHKMTTYLERLKHREAYGDSRRINQIIMNLVENAANYTPENGRISLTMREIPVNNPGVGCYEIVVEDNGIGMHPEFVEHIFEPFIRADDSRVEKIPGSGLGLTITKNIVCKMSGAINVQSEPEKGTKVTVRIFLRLPETYTSIMTNTDSFSPEAIKDVAVMEIFKEQKLTGKRVLIAEDNDSNAEILRSILQMTGLEADHVWNGKEAVDRLALAEDGYYDIVFMDIIMPMMDGYEAAIAIRKSNREYLKKLPIIAMSANANDDDRKASMAAGMNEYLIKPVDIKQLEEVLGKFLSVDKG